MEALREAILERRALEAQRRVERAMECGAPAQEILSALFGVAAGCAPDAQGTPHGLLLVAAADRIVTLADRLGLARHLFGAVAWNLALAEREDEEAHHEPGPLEPGDTTLEHALLRGDAPAAAGALLGLEDPQREPGLRLALLDVGLLHDGPRGHTLALVDALRRGMERASRADRRRLALCAARHLVARVREHPGAEPAAEAAAPLRPPPSAGELLLHLRRFHAPAARAALESLVAAGRGTEALTVLVRRALERSGVCFHRLLLAAAARRFFQEIEARRDVLLRRVLERLLDSGETCAVLEGLADGVEAATLPARERRRALDRLESAIRRGAPDEALAEGRRLVGDAEGAEGLRALLLRRVSNGACRQDPHLFLAVASCLDLAEDLGPATGRLPLLRGVYALAAERTP